MCCLLPISLFISLPIFVSSFYGTLSHHPITYHSMCNGKGTIIVVCRNQVISIITKHFNISPVDHPDLWDCCNMLDFNGTNVERVKL